MQQYNTRTLTVITVERLVGVLAVQQRHVGAVVHLVVVQRVEAAPPVLVPRRDVLVVQRQRARRTVPPLWNMTERIIII